MYSTPSYIFPGPGLPSDRNLLRFIQRQQGTPWTVLGLKTVPPIVVPALPSPHAADLQIPTRLSGEQFATINNAQFTLSNH